MFDSREHYKHPLRMKNERRRCIPISIHVGEEHPIDRNFIPIEEHMSLMLHFTLPETWQYHTARFVSINNGRDVWSGWLDEKNRFLIPMPIVHRDSLTIWLLGFTNQAPLPPAHIIYNDREHLVATTDQDGNHPEIAADHWWAAVPYTGRDTKYLVYRCGHFVCTTETPGDWIKIQGIEPWSDKYPSGYMSWVLNDFPIKIEKEDEICKRTYKSSRTSRNTSLLKRYAGKQMRLSESPRMKKETQSMDSTRPTLH